MNSRHNGWAIEALASPYEFLGDKVSLHLSLCAAEKAIAKMGLPSGGFARSRHETDADRLGDTLAMARALLQLYRFTALPVSYASWCGPIRRRTSWR